MQRDRATAVWFGWWVFNTSWMPTTVSKKSSWPVRPWWLAMCITALLSHILACSGWSAARAQPTPLVEIHAFCTKVGHILANISGGRGQFPVTPVGVEILEISLFRMVLRYWQTIISFCHNTRIWQTDRQTHRQNCDSNTVYCITCSRTVVQTKYISPSKSKVSINSSACGIHTLISLLIIMHNKYNTTCKYLVCMHSELSRPCDIETDT